MTATEEPPTVAERVAHRFGLDDEADDPPRFVVPALAVVAAVLVVASVVAATEAGLTGVGAGYLATVALFVGAVAAFEADRRFGG
jgi:hypothetical protein